MKKTTWFLFFRGLLEKEKVKEVFERQIRWRPAACFILSLMLFPFVVNALAEVLRKPSTFHIAANTEVLDMVTTGVSATRWYAQQADAVVGAPDPLVDSPMHSFAFSGLVEIGPRSNVRMVRYGSGPLHIILQEHEAGEGKASGALFDAQKGGQPGEEAQEENNRESRAIPVATLENLLNAKTTWHWADSASLQVHIEDLPFSGSLLAVGAIGSETYAASVGEPPPTLRAGRVIVMEKRLFSDLRYPVMELDLQLGDEVWVTDANGNPADTACVFSAAGQSTAGIEVACHATGRTLKVSRFGGHLVEMEPGPWDMFFAEPTLQVLVPVLLSVIYLLFRWLIKLTFPPRNVHLSASEQ